MQDYPRTEISRYNEAVFQIQRLNMCWALCNSYARQGRLIKWKWELDNIWRELSSDVSNRMKKDREKNISKNEEHIQKIAEAKTLTSLYRTLNDRHEFLRSLQDKAGKGGKYEDEGGDDFD